MSLRIEQNLDDFYFTESEPRIYTTGAYLVPMEIRKSKEKGFIWVVDEFRDDTYDDNGKLCSPYLFTKRKTQLMNK